MKSYGMTFLGKEILEPVNGLPAWSEGDIGRFVYNIPEDKVYYCGATEWRISSGDFTTVISANTGVTLTTSDFGKTITVNSASDQIVTLPSVSSTNIGKASFKIVKLGAGKVTIQTADSDVIVDSSAGGTIFNEQTTETFATITLFLVSETLWVISDAFGTWQTS